MTNPAFPAEPFQTITGIHLSPTPLAVVRTAGVRTADLPALFDAGFPALGALIARGALTPLGPAVAVYAGDPDSTFDLEIGFPVGDPLAAPLQVDGIEVIPSTLPPGPAVALTHLGHFDGLPAAWESLVAGADAHPTGAWIEVYVTEPGGDLTAQRTDLILPTGRERG